MNSERQSLAVLAGLAFVADWNMACRARLNVLLVNGANDTAVALVDDSRQALSAPVITVRCTDRFALRLADWVGTLVLLDVGRLTPIDQHHLTAWLDRKRPQVISTSPASILPLVQAGHFLESLYYRLNTIYLDASGLAPIGTEPVPARVLAQSSR